MSYLHDQTLADFVNHEHSRLAQLKRPHVLSLRMHTSLLMTGGPLPAWLPCTGHGLAALRTRLSPWAAAVLTRQANA